MKNKSFLFKGLITVLAIFFGASIAGLMLSYTDVNIIAAVIVFAVITIVAILFIWFADYEIVAVFISYQFGRINSAWWKNGLKIIAVLALITGIYFAFFANKDTPVATTTPSKKEPVVIHKKWIVTHKYTRDTLVYNEYEHRDSFIPGKTIIIEPETKKHFYDGWFGGNSNSQTALEKQMTDGGKTAPKQESATPASDPNSSKAKIIITKEENGKETAKATVEITAPKSESSFGTQTSPPKSSKGTYVAEDETGTVVRNTNNDQQATSGILSNLRKGQ